MVKRRKDGRMERMEGRDSIGAGHLFIFDLRRKTQNYFNFNGWNISADWPREHWTARRKVHCKTIQPGVGEIVKK